MSAPSRLQWLPLSVVAAPLLAALPVQGAQYATPDQAAKRSFPQATSFRDTVVRLSPEDMQAVAKLSGLPARSAQWHVLVALNGEQPLGVVVLDGVVGKFELIDYAVAIGAEGKVRNVEILTYRESHGYEIRLPAWRKQFIDKDKTAPIRLGEDIASISGATMSCEHVTDGVRRIVSVVSVLRAAGKL